MNFDLANSAVIVIVTALKRVAFILDFLFSTGNQVSFWSKGNNIASPHAVGVAALMSGKNGGLFVLPGKSSIKSFSRRLRKTRKWWYYGGGWLII